MYTPLFYIGIGLQIAFIISLVVWHVHARQRREFIRTHKPNVSDIAIRIYVTTHWPGWSWDWTTVGRDGRPQIVIKRNGMMGPKWHLVEQWQIEKREVKLVNLRSTCHEAGMWQRYDKKLICGAILKGGHCCEHPQKKVLYGGNTYNITDFLIKI